MIQRIQSVYLLIASLFSGILVLFTCFGNKNKGVCINFTDFFTSDDYMVFSTGFLFYASSLLSFIAIFLYQNRIRQILLGRINVVINLIIIFILIFYLQSLSGEIPISVKGIGVFIPLISLGLIVFANKAIKKDEHLVKSVDRLR